MKKQTGQPATGKDTRLVSDRLERYAWRLWKFIRQRLGFDLQRTHVFVAGQQRSGTNMLMEVLEWSLYTDVYHETDPRAFDKYEMRPRPVIRVLAQRSPAPFFIIKSLCELDELPELLNEYSQSKAIWIVRSYEDSVNSAIRSFKHFADQTRRLSQDKTSAGWRGRGMSDTTQEHLRNLYHPAISEASAAALMWYYRNVLFFERGLEQDPRVRLTFYENLVTFPQSEFEKIFNFLEIPDYTRWITRKIFATSVRKSVQPDIDPGVRELCDGLTARFKALN